MLPDLSSFKKWPQVFFSSRPTLSIQQHPPTAPISIQRPAQPRDTATRITLPSHPAIGAQKQQLHTMAQVNWYKQD